MIADTRCFEDSGYLFWNKIRYNGSYQRQSIKEDSVWMGVEFKDLYLLGVRSNLEAIDDYSYEWGMSDERVHIGAVPWSE